MDENKVEESESTDLPEKEKGFFEELVGEALNLDRGLFATIYNMFKNPGLVIDSYFNDKKRFTNPFRYAIVILAVTTLVTTLVVDYEQFFKNAMEAGMSSQGRSLEEMSAQMKEIAPEFDFDGYIENLQEFSFDLTTKFNSILYIILFAPVVSMFTYLFYSGTRKRFVQHYVMNLYGMIQGAILTMFLLPIASLIGEVNFYISFVTTAILLGYLAWVIYSYMPGKGVGDAFKIIIALLLSYVVFSLLLAITMYVGAAIKMFYF